MIGSPNAGTGDGWSDEGLGGKFYEKHCFIKDIKRDSVGVSQQSMHAEVPIRMVSDDKSVQVHIEFLAM